MLRFAAFLGFCASAPFLSRPSLPQGRGRVQVQVRRDVQAPKQSKIAQSHKHLAEAHILPARYMPGIRTAPDGPPRGEHKHERVLRTSEPHTK